MRHPDRRFSGGQREARRLDLPVTDRHTGYDARAWNLGVPLIVYELWPDSTNYCRAMTVWHSLSTSERKALGLPTSSSGHLAATTVLIPKIQSFFADSENLVVCGGESEARRLAVYCEVEDGQLTIARASAPVAPESTSVVHSTENSPVEFVRIHYRDSNLESLGAAVGDSPDAVFRLPRQTHGLSGSDFRIGLLGSDGLVDTCRIGLIRGIGAGYFTSEPWRVRAASLGFSAPARVIHVPPTPEGCESAFSELRTMGVPASFKVADPYAESEYLERLGDLLPGTRLLTGSKKLQERRITHDWSEAHQVEIRVLNNLHDRFMTGSRSAAIMGASFNGLGKQHSFLVIVDAIMQQELVRVFDDLWSKANPLPNN